MSRGGRGGAGLGGVGRMNGQALPFDVDTALEDQVAANAYLNGEEESLYPPMNVHMARPPTAHEKRLVQLTREVNEERRNGPFFIGDAIGKRDASTFNAFEDVRSFNNQKAKRIKSGKPDLSDVPIVRELLPPELQDIVSSDEDEDPAAVKAAKAKKKAYIKKKNAERIANIQEGGDIEPAADDDDEDDAKDPDADEDDVEVPSDDDFSEDDSDMADDYNAEKYFEDGEADDDGDDGGGEEGY